MHAWTDKHGTRHTIDLDIPAAKRVRDECGVDIVAPLTDARPEVVQQPFAELINDPTLVISCLAVIEDTDNPDEFGRLFHGGALREATDALLSAVVDFFQYPWLTTLLTKTQTHLQTMSDTATGKAMQAIENLDLDSVLSASVTHGNGSNESSESSTTTGGG